MTSNNYGESILIENIQQLQQFGIFHNYANDSIANFGRYNLFYGWNGSGKSTLSTLFRCIENRNISNEFPLAKFKVGISGDSVITQANISDTDLHVCTFNQEFVEENISWNQIVKSILLIDKEKITEREKLEELKKQQKADIESHGKEELEIQKLNNELAKFGTDSAKRMKTSLRSIDTTDSHYLNYNKTKFEKCISQNSEIIETGESLLDDTKIIELTNSAKPDQKPPVMFSKHLIDAQMLVKAATRLNALLTESVVSQTIKRLVEHSDVKAWVETGLALHNEHKASQCEFCGNEVTSGRIEQLEAHFNDSYKEFQNRLIAAENWLTEQFIQQPDLPSDSQFYDEFKENYHGACTSLKESISILNEQISTWLETLKKKISNPLDTRLSVTEISDVSIESYNDAMVAIEKEVNQHNHKSSNFKEETTKAKKSLELHFATAELRDFGYQEKKERLDQKEIKNRADWEVIQKRQREIDVLENDLSNEGLGADQFNESLHKFLGRSELTLRFNSEKKGYEIIRNDSDPVDGKLSEGEKTAIAFVYFITKISENDNKIENTIVVVDDPVSSFDSNHLFHAYSFLRSNCHKAKQLFVFTHNFTYFKLMRDWFEGGNKNRKRKNPPKEPNAFFYTIEANTNMPRQSSIKNANSSLVNYNSEYHYIFSKLYHYKDNQTLSRDEAFLTANLSRKLLESFFSFKFPKYRNDIAQLMNRGLSGCDTTDESTKEKIYRFINKYSHSAVIEVNEDSSENLVGESHNVIGDIFGWIQELDKVHFDEMLEVVS